MVHDERSPSAKSLTLIAAFETTYVPAYDVDVSELTDGLTRWTGDVQSSLAAGVRDVRHALRWHRIEPEPGRFDWSATDRALEYLRDQDASPIVDLVHHTSYPDWLTDGFRDRHFGPSYLRFAEAVAHRYPWLPAYTLFNEPFATLFLAGHEALWPPYDHGIEGFRRLLCSVLPAVTEAGVMFRELLPGARHIWVDTAEHHTGSGPGRAYAVLANDRRHVVLDLALHHETTGDRPFLRQLLADEGESLLGLPPVPVDVLGLDYYCHSEWYYDEHGAHAPSPQPIGLAAVAKQYSRRYGLPMMLTETNIRGLPSDRVSWLRYTLEQYELAVADGVPFEGYCWFPQVSSCDWDSLLARAARRVDPVGVYDVGATGRRIPTPFTTAWQAVAAGARASDLPAYRFQSPCSEQLAGYLPSLAHWPWEDAVEPLRPVSLPAETQEDRVPPRPSAPDLVVLSHLRWTWVWQRPQHLIARIARWRAEDGARVWFVEEPVFGDVSEPVLRLEERDGITRVWLVLPQDGSARAPGFHDAGAAAYGAMIADLLAEERRPPSPDVWLYTPMAFNLAQSLGAGRLIYDVMDDLSSFLGAPPGLKLRQRRALSEADVVFAGGRSLREAVLTQRDGDVHLFPSGVESAHYARSRRLRRRRARKVAGYVGVVDERMDLDLLEQVARQLSDWTIRVVGPVTKIDPGELPEASNLEYVGFVAYDALPEVMAGFDVAMMPFALNEATRAISPTKTLEYFAAGLPVVSTRVHDVVRDYGHIVYLADDAVSFAEACRTAVESRSIERQRRADAVLSRSEWDAIAGAMADILVTADRRSGALEAQGGATA